MSTLATWTRLIEFDDWANAEVLRRLRETEPSCAALGWLGHILAARELWLARLRSESRRVEVWPASTLASCAAQSQEVVPAWRAYLGALDPKRLEAEVSYTNSKGEPWTSRVSEVLLHVGLHGSHHRGQIASDLCARGHEPAYVDFIHAARTGRV